MKGKIVVIIFLSNNCFAKSINTSVPSLNTFINPEKDTIIKPGSMNLQQAAKFFNDPKNKNVNVLPTSKQPSNSDPIIENTLGDTGSKYDVGYIAGNGTSLKEYRKKNQNAVIRNNIEIIEKILLGIGIFVGFIFLIRFIIKKWTIIRKFFMGST